MKEDSLKAAMREMGRRGAKARMVKLTAEQRSAIARKAAAASAKVRAKKAAGKRTATKQKG